MFFAAFSSVFQTISWQNFYQELLFLLSRRRQRKISVLFVGRGVIWPVGQRVFLTFTTEKHDIRWTWFWFWFSSGKVFRITFQPSGTSTSSFEPQTPVLVYFEPHSGWLLSVAPLSSFVYQHMTNFSFQPSGTSASPGPVFHPFGTWSSSTS